jgi:hypothetical protein
VTRPDPHPLCCALHAMVRLANDPFLTELTRLLVRCNQTNKGSVQLTFKRCQHRQQQRRIAAPHSRSRREADRSAVTRMTHDPSLRVFAIACRPLSSQTRLMKKQQLALPKPQQPQPPPRLLPHLPPPLPPPLKARRTKGSRRQRPASRLQRNQKPRQPATAAAALPPPPLPPPPPPLL